MALAGNLEEASHDRIRGWAYNPDAPGEAVVLHVLVDGVRIARLVANSYRQDLEVANIGDGRHSFNLDSAAFKLPLSPCSVHVCDLTGAELPNSPTRVETPMELNGAGRQAIVAMLDSPASDDDIRARAMFLAEQANRLLDRLAARQSGRTAREAARTRRWRWRPEDGPAPPVLAPRALVIDSTLPVLSRDAGSNAIVSHMRSLQRLGFEVVFAPADMRDGPGAAELAALGIATVAEPWTCSVEELMRRQDGLFDLVYFHKLDAAARYVPLARHTQPRARRVYCVGDLHSLRLSRQAQAEDRPELVAQANLARMLELTAAASCHAVVTHSTAELAILRRALPHAATEVVPWAVLPRPTPAGFEQRHGVAFVGNFSHGPNLDAAIWLMDEIMPEVWRSAPEIVCQIVGSNMPAAVSAPRDARIRTVGHVADLADVFRAVRMTAAPLAFGAGLKGKVAESMAAGVPCVCTPLAAEGFDLPGPIQSFVAQDTAGLAAAIVRLHADPAAFAACRDAGLAYVARVFSEPAVDAAMRRAAGLPAATAAASTAQLTAVG